MKRGRVLAFSMTALAIAVILGTISVSYYLQNPGWFVAGSGVAVVLATIALLWLTVPLVESSDHLVTSYENLRYRENKKDSIEEARKRHGAWFVVSQGDSQNEDLSRFLSQGVVLAGDPWLPDYRNICEIRRGERTVKDPGAAMIDIIGKARQRMAQFERIIEDLERRPSSEFSEVEDLADPDAYMIRRKMFPYKRTE